MALSACGGGTSAKTLVKAADATLGSGRFDATYNATLAQSGSAAIAFRGSGTVDAASHRSRVSIDLSGLATNAGLLKLHGPLVGPSQGDFRGTEFVDSSGQVVIYVRVPFYEQRLPAGKSWLRVDFGKSAHEHGIAPGELTLDQDPGQYLEFLRGASGKVTKVGKETVDGVPTTHYSTTVELFDYPKSYSGDRKFAAEQLADRIVQLTQTSTYPTDVWVDKQGHVRQLTFAYAIPGSATTTPIDYKLRLRYSGFGQPARVSLPPASQVATIKQLQTS